VAGPKKVTWLRVNRRDFTHALRTTLAAMASYLVARWCGLPESYWATVSTLIVTQSTVGAAWTVSKDRLAGTALGAAAGGGLATYAAEDVALFGVGLFALGVLCAFLRVRRSAYRYAGITLAIVMLIARTQPAWIIAVHRFIEISIGIAVGLMVAALWPESEAQFAAGASDR